MTEYTVLHLPNKFAWLLKDAISHRMAQMQALLDDDNTPDEKLAEIDYGNDKWILEIIYNDLANKNNRVAMDFYQISQNSDATETTLQSFGKPIPTNEKLVMVFSASDVNQAMAIHNQFLGFEPYKPMPETVTATQTLNFIDEQGIDHQLVTTLYHPQQFGEQWQCDYQFAGYGLQIYETVKADNGFTVLNMAMTAIANAVEQFKRENPQLVFKHE